MIVGYLFIGTVAGVVAFATALIAGRSMGIAFVMYAAVGAAVTMLIPLAHIALESLVLRRLPRAKEDEDIRFAPRPEATMGANAPAAKRSVRILAVDDDPFILGLIPIIAENSGFSEVTPVDSGQLALDALADSHEPYDCILLDISMPGMSGIELCERIRDIPTYRNTPIVMLTGMRDIKSMDRAFQAGASDYVTKPFDIAELGARLKLFQDSVEWAGDRDMAADSKQMRNAGAKHPEAFGLPGGEDLSACRAFIDQGALANYLSLLSPTEAANTHIMAVKIDRFDTSRAQLGAAHYSALLDRVSASLLDVFDADKTVTAYAGGGTFLIAAQNADTRLSEELETEINEGLERQSHSVASDVPHAVSVSVGKPVRPRGNKEQRSDSTFARAITLVNSRALEKRAIAGTLRLVG